MFQDSKSGQTHSFGDGCGEPAHNTPEKWEDTFEEKVKTSYARGGFLTADYDNSWVIDTESIKDFIRHELDSFGRAEYHRGYEDANKKKSINERA